MDALHRVIADRFSLTAAEQVLVEQTIPKVEDALTLMKIAVSSNDGVQVMTAYQEASREMDYLMGLLSAKFRYISSLVDMDYEG